MQNNLPAILSFFLDENTISRPLVGTGASLFMPMYIFGIEGVASGSFPMFLSQGNSNVLYPSGDVGLTPS